MAATVGTTIDYENLTLNPEEARSVSDTIQEELYARPEIADVHNVQTGVNIDKYIPLLGQFGMVGKLDPGGCSVNSETGQIPISQKQWAPKLISFRMEHCQANIPELIKFWQKSMEAAGIWETIDNSYLAFVKDRALDAVTRSVLRISEFGNTGASAVGDNTGDQTLTSGTAKAYFTPLNGMWAQIFTDAGSKSYRYTITENAGASKTAQLALASDRALKVFRALYNEIDPRAFDGNLKFQVTRSLFNNWQDFMEDKSQVFMLDRTEKGSTSFSYRGIPIVIRNDWDRTIRTYMDNGTTYNIPHRAILTDINNIPIGTSDSQSLSEFRSFYDFRDKKHYMDVAYKIDQKNLLEYALASAY